MVLKLARPLSDARLQKHFELASGIRATDDPPHRDADWGRERIFVSIAAFRDPECQNTIRDLFEKARRPERVSIGLIWQFDPNADRDYVNVPAPRPGQVREMRFDWRESEGVCWARFLAQALWRGEEYFLQIDSHMKFEDGWDERAISDLASCPSDKAILASASPPYLSPGDILSDLYPGILRTDGFLGSGVIRVTGIWTSEPLRQHYHMPFLMAGGIFSKGGLIAEVPYDPYQCFDLEEMSYAVRTYTHGWDIYTPRERIMWHQYKRNNTIRRGGFDDAVYQRNQNSRARLALTRFDHMTRHGRSEDPEPLRDIDLFGLGAARKLSDYEDFSGLDFRFKRASEWAMRAWFIPDVNDVAKFSVPTLDGQHPAPERVMTENERLLRQALRKWERDQLARELADLMAAVSAADMAQAKERARTRIDDAEHRRLVSAFRNWDEDALVAELAKLAWGVAQTEHAAAAGELQVAG